MVEMAVWSDLSRVTDWSLMKFGLCALYQMHSRYIVSYNQSAENKYQVHVSMGPIRNIPDSVNKRQQLGLD